MTTYTETPTGGAVGNGCGFLSYTIVLESDFEVGDLVYVIESARDKGKIEKIAIKKIIGKDPGNLITYVDTFNRVWLEDELTASLTEVQDLQQAHLTRKVNSLSKYLEELC